MLQSAALFRGVTVLTLWLGGPTACVELVQHHDALENRAGQGQLVASRTQHQSELTKAGKQNTARQVPEQTVCRSIKQASIRSQLCDLNAATPPASALQHLSRHGTDKEAAWARGGDAPSCTAYP